MEAFVLGQCGSANKGSSLYSEVMGSGAVKDPLSRTTLSPIHTPQVCTQVCQIHKCV